MERTQTGGFEAYQELALRENDAISVRLLWSKTDDSLAVAVADDRLNDAFVLAVEPREALDVFEHPYAYAASRGVDHFAAHSGHADDLEGAERS